MTPVRSTAAGILAGFLALVLLPSATGAIDVNTGVTVVVVPNAPTSLTAASASATQINLSWTDNATDETGFVIQRKTTGDYSQISTVAANTTSFSDTGLTAGTTYTYRIYATGAEGDSSFSNEA